MDFRSHMAKHLVLVIAIFATFQLSFAVSSDLVLLKVDRRVENIGLSTASEVLLAFPPGQDENLAYLKAASIEGKGKNKASIPLAVNPAQSEDAPAGVTFFSISLVKALNKGESVTLEVLTVFTHSLKPFPEEISQAQVQLVVYRDSAYFLSPYQVKVQTTTLRTPTSRIESYTRVDPTKLVDAELKYGPYENRPAFSFSPAIVHFENNQPFAVVKELVREIEISHWGNVQVVEHYTLIHGGALNKGGFSRIEYQARPNTRGASSFRNLVARLPPRAHSVYYRDEIGNISTSHLWSDSKKTELEIEPRYPMFGGWQATFTIGYGLPLQDFLFLSADGRRYLNITFGCPFDGVIIDNVIVKVALPEGSKDPSVSVPFPVDQHHEIKYSYLDTVGRTVVVLSKKNVVPEHNMFFQVQDAIQRLQNVINLRLTVSEKLETSLRDLARTGDVQACKAARKAADATLKDTAKELKSILEFLQSSSQASHILSKVEELIHKEKEKQDRLLLKHSVVVDCYDKKLPMKEIDSRIASHEQKLVVLKQEVDELLQAVDEI